MNDNLSYLFFISMFSSFFEEQVFLIAYFFHLIDIFYQKSSSRRISQEAMLYEYGLFCSRIDQNIAFHACLAAQELPKKKFQLPRDINPLLNKKKSFFSPPSLISINVQERFMDAL
jgi:hypothetical protein